MCWWIETLAGPGDNPDGDHRPVATPIALLPVPDSNLVRHPRNRKVWGLDIQALPQQGRWTLRFALNGPSGSGTGDVAITVLEQPGPPMGISWAISSLPLLGLVTLIVTGWRRTWPPSAQPQEERP